RDPPGTEFDRSTLEGRKPLEDAVIDESAEKHLRREGNDHEVLEAKVLTPAEPVGRALAAIVMVGGTEDSRTAADVHHERHPSFGETRPDRVEIRVARRSLAGRRGRHPYGAAAPPQREVDLDRRPRWIA